MQKRVSIEVSTKATWLSFVMSIFVIYIHANNLKDYGLENEVSSVAYQLVQLLAVAIGGMAVPFFFMLSGYFLFRFDVTSWNVKTFLTQKILKKWKTLLLPYLLWNSFGYMFFYFVPRIPLATRFMNATVYLEFSFQAIFNALIFHENYYTFWYLQDLMVLNGISFIFLFCFKDRARQLIACVAVLVVTILQLDFVIFRTIDSVFFFFLGAVLAVNGRKFLETKLNKNAAFRAMALLLIIIAIRYWQIPVISRILFLASPVVLWFAMDVFELKKMFWFVKQSFFIYAAHLVIVTIVSKVLTRIIGIASVCFLLTPWITVFIIYLIAKILSRSLPRFYGIICGNRG